MGMVKNQQIQYEMDQEDLRAGLVYLQKFGKKCFTDSNGEWREIKPSAQLNIFGHNHIEYIPHLIAENNDDN